jgi:hypothetical protein
MTIGLWVAHMTHPADYDGAPSPTIQGRNTGESTTQSRVSSIRESTCPAKPIDVKHGSSALMVMFIRTPTSAGCFYPVRDWPLLGVQRRRNSRTSFWKQAVSCQ